MTGRILSVAATFATLALAACAGTPYPDLSQAPPAAWSTPAEADAHIQPAAWWKTLGSADLDAWVSKALARNYDLKSAEANLQAARAIVREARAAGLPSGTADLSLQRLRQPAGAQPPGVAPGVVFPDQTLLDQGLTLGWEMDLGGRIKGMEDMALSSATAAAWQRRQTEAAVAAQTVAAYLDWREAVSEQVLIEKRLHGLQDIEGLAVRARAAGAVSNDDLERARIDVESLSAEQARIAARIHSAARQLNVLAGEAPATIMPGMADAVTMPAGLPDIDPGATLRLRPDVGLAEAGVRQAAGQAAVNRADLYPTITLTGSLGQSGAPADIGADSSFRFSVGPQLRWGIFNWEQTRARIRSADARTEAAYMHWHSVTLAALQEAEDAIEGWKVSTAALNSAHLSAEAAGRISQQARRKLDTGLIGRLEFLKTDDAGLSAALGETQARFQALQAWSHACLALGAGWKEEAPQAPQAPVARVPGYGS